MEKISVAGLRKIHKLARRPPNNLVGVRHLVHLHVLRCLLVLVHAPCRAPRVSERLVDIGVDEGDVGDAVCDGDADYGSE